MTTISVTDSAGQVTTATIDVPVTISDMLMGCSASVNDHGGTEVWDGWRCYNKSKRDSLANRTGTQRPKFLAYSQAGENLGGANPNYTTVYNAALADLNAFYYTTGQTHSTRWGIKLYWSNGNENHDKGALTRPLTPAKVQAFVTSQKALYDAVHYIDPVTGQRKFPDAYAGSNPVHEAEMSGEIEEYLHPSAQYHDFVMWSMYPPGRQTTESDPTFNWPTTSKAQEADWSDREKGFLMRCFRRTKLAEAVAGHPIMICVGEIGIGDNPADSTTRPYYAVHGLAHSLLTLSVEYDLSIPFACWWDNQTDSTSPQNILSDEPTTTNPSTRVAWQNHLSYNHLRGGTHPASWVGNPKTAWKDTGTPV